MIKLMVQFFWAIPQKNQCTRICFRNTSDGYRYNTDYDQNQFSSNPVLIVIKPHLNSLLVIREESLAQTVFMLPHRRGINMRKLKRASFRCRNDIQRALGYLNINCIGEGDRTCTNTSETNLKYTATFM